MFPEDALFDYVLETLADALASYPAPEQNPTRYDRWISRSLLQKAVRRGEVALAHRALATLMLADPGAIWRHLIIIAIEDVGVPGMDTVAAVIAAARHRKWRASFGEWKVAAYLVEQMCQSTHCQAACDLLLRSINDPALEQQRAEALDATMSELAAYVGDKSSNVLTRGIAVLAVGGGLAEGQRRHDPGGAFDLLADRGYASHVVATCRAAWKTTRNEMALLLPLVWREWMASGEAHTVSNDTMPLVAMISDLPGYVVDQFTRVGGNVARAYLSADPDMVAILDRAEVPRAQQPRAIGDLMFLSEGSCVRDRAVWCVGDQLRKPQRMLPWVARLDGGCVAALDQLAAKAPVLAKLRRDHITCAGGSRPL